MSAQIQEQIDVQSEVISADVTSGVDGSWRSMSDHRRVVYVCTVTSLSDGDQVTLTINQATDGSGTSSKSLKSSSSTSSGGSDVTIELEADVEELDVANGFSHLRPNVNSDSGTSSQGNCYSLRGQGRYKPE